MEIRPEEIKKLKETPFELFDKSLTVAATRRNYLSSLKKIICEFFGPVLKGDPELIQKQKTELKNLGKKNKKSYFDADFEIRVNEFVQRAKSDPDWCEAVLIKLTQEFNKNLEDKTNSEFRGLGTSTNYLKIVKKLLDLNKVSLNWDRIFGYLANEEFKEDTRGYTRKEIQRMLEHSKNIMDRLIVLLGASAGIRAGAFVLKWGNLKPIYQYKEKYLFEEYDITESVVREGKLVAVLIRVYANSNYEYFAFSTHEFWQCIQEYRKKWEYDIGRLPKDDDPFFRKAGYVVRPLTKDGIEKRLLRIAKESQIRKPLKKGQRLHEIPLFNGLRRFFNKANKNSLSKNSTLASLILKETMMGHGSLIKLDKSYFKEHIDELIEEYLIAIPNLTISDALQKEAENVELVKRVSELEKQKEESQLQKDEVQRNKEAIVTVREKHEQAMNAIREELKQLKTAKQNSSK